MARTLHPVERLDLAVAEAAALPKRSRRERVVSAVAGTGDQPPLIAACAITIAVGAAARDDRLTRTGLRMLSAHAFSIMGKLLLKGVVDRTRPDDAIEHGRYKMEQGGSKDGDLRSMPSGHSAGTVAVAVAAANGYPQAGPVLATGAAAIVGAQLPSRNHFLSDVLAGSAIGLLSALIAGRLVPARDNEVRPARP